MVKLRARVCRTLLFVDPAEQNLRFDDVVVNEVCDATVTVRNLSEIPLTFKLSLASSTRTIGG